MTLSNNLSPEDQAVLDQMERIQKLARDRGLLDVKAPYIEQSHPAISMPAPQSPAAEPELPTAELLDTTESEAALEKLKKFGVTERVMVKLAEPNGVMTARIAQWQKKASEVQLSPDVLSAEDMGAIFADPEFKKMTDSIIIDSLTLPSYINCLTALMVAFGQQSIGEMKSMRERMT